MPFDMDLDEMMRESVEADRKEDAGAAGGEPSPAASPSAEGAESGASTEAAPETPADTGSSDGRARGPDGKFIKAEDGAPAKEPVESAPAEQDTKVSDQPVTAGIQTPVSWSAAAKAEFSKLPLIVQEAIAKREMEVSSGFKQYGERVKQYEAIDKTLAPLDGALQQHNLSRADYVQRLVAADQRLSANPEAGLKWIAAQYSIDLAQLAQGQPQTEVNPEVHSLRQEVQELRQWRDSQEQARQTAFQTEIANDIERFQSDPKNEFFSQVREDMAALMSAAASQDRALSLEDAYQRACRMNDSVWAIMQARQADAREKELRTKATAKVASALPAAGVKGNGAGSPVATGSWEDTLRDVTSASFRG